MKVYQYRHDGMSTGQYHQMFKWCCENFGTEYYYGDQSRWSHQYPTFYFRNEQDYTFFLLKWS